MKRDQETRKPGELFPWRCVSCHQIAALDVLDAWESQDDDGERYRYTLARCPDCMTPYVLLQELVQVGNSEWEWDAPEQMYPKQRRLDWSIPSGIRAALVESSASLGDRRWFSAGLGARRAVEMLCADFGAAGRDLKAKLEWLRDNGHIDAVTYEWSDAVRTVGNDAAHGTDGVSEEDAEDAIEFAVSLCDLLYVVPKRLERHNRRRIL